MCREPACPTPPSRGRLPVRWPRRRQLLLQPRPQLQWRRRGSNWLQAVREGYYLLPPSRSGTMRALCSAVEGHPVGGGVANSLDELADRISNKLLRFRWIAASTLGLAGFSFWLGKAGDWWYVPAGLGVLVFTLLGLAITWARDRQVRAERQRAVSVAQRLWATLTGAGLPVIKTLGDICAGATSTATYNPRAALLTHVLDATRFRLGDDLTSNRASFYELTAPDRLTLVQWAGRHGPPRHSEWRRDDLPAGQAKLNFVDGTIGGQFEDVPDVAKAALHGFVQTGAGYASYLTTRVTAGGQTFGLLCVDSPEPGNFAERDKNALAMLAGLLAAGLAAASRQ